MQIYTQFIYEKTWSKTTKEQAVKIIKEEMPQTDPEATLSYILQEIQKGKIITFGECRFKLMDH
ncbi:MAG: hypothetical protein IE885_09185 [Campylobacterales bacterium]|nr:hypothetical protein [Campylobacterales bacterium]